ncbi:MAG: hypothetical protein FGM18_09500 [Burkholderiaceae bacterium]|nr:hypothetical protein [Burkholderiaceae bacterium]
MSRRSTFAKLVPVIFALITVIAAFFAIRSQVGVGSSNVPVALGVIFLLLVLLMALNSAARKSRLAGDADCLSVKISNNAIGGATLFFIIAALGTLAVRGL